MSRLEDIRARVQGRLRAKADLMYPETLTFRLGPHEWKDVRCSVVDKQLLKPDALARLQAVATDQRLSVLQLRVVDVHPDDTVPFPGASTPFQGGTLEILEWSDPDPYTGLRVGTAVKRDP
ncbi:hypothetical protein [Deinococcus multiflagellatus]|uniref:Uncharacterized protein n=1 Tax=Deinococcus multiflagellatus TaxID=1656887 RepID=A0ABW1ZHV4_9DEIO|nr:hypothetical protein [Deinococcus multiflagellatus]MBZ9713754.1 hypothetical protein [Deinococcus multiflagellatus]